MYMESATNVHAMLQTHILSTAPITTTLTRAHYIPSFFPNEPTSLGSVPSPTLMASPLASCSARSSASRSIRSCGGYTRSSKRSACRNETFACVGSAILAGWGKRTPCSAARSSKISLSQSNSAYTIRIETRKTR
jgi:hypothetical protein